jgi:hypothetical protein
LCLYAMVDFLEQNVTCHTLDLSYNIFKAGLALFTLLCSSTERENSLTRETSHKGWRHFSRLFCSQNTLN